MKKTDAIKFFGSKAKLARYIGVARCTITKWPDDVPPVWAYRLEKLTKGKLKANDPWLAHRAA